jgi:hypothetical protein
MIDFIGTFGQSNLKAHSQGAGESGHRIKKQLSAKQYCMVTNLQGACSARLVIVVDVSIIHFESLFH